MKLTVKKSIKAVTLSFCMLLVAFASQSALAENRGTDRTTEKAREAVENASPDDWKTYAESAERCIKKGVNLKEASSWLDKSLAIKETAYNLKVKGLYYEKNNLPEEALQAYVKSLKAGLAQDINYVDSETQKKVAELSKKI